MLLRFWCNNFLSFRGDASFSMIASGGKAKQRYSENYETLCDADVLKTAVIVGENAGGKTNFINAFDFLKFLFKRVDKPIYSFPDLVFLGDENESGKQSFCLEVIAADNCIYEYELSMDFDGIISEKLSWRKSYRRKKILVFSTVRQSVEDDENETKATYSIHANTKKPIDSIMNNDGSLGNGLMVNKLALIGIDHVAPFVNWVNDTLSVKMTRLPLDMKYAFEYQHRDSAYFRKVLHSEEFFDIFKLVDSSIVRIEVSDEKPFEQTSIIRKSNDTEWTVVLADDSSGVQQFFAFALEIYKVVHEKKVVFADELDSTLNPVLTGRIINYIHSYLETGQLVFTTHNVTHLNLQTFMKEQMYVVSKCRQTLESCIHSLGEFKELRYDSNNKLYEYYLKGLFGGVDNGQ